MAKIGLDERSRIFDLLAFSTIHYPLSVISYQFGFPFSFCCFVLHSLQNCMNLFIPLVLSMFLAAGVFAQNGSVTATPPPKQDDTNIEINRKPLADFADDLAKQWESKQIDLNQNFTVVLNGVLTKDGKFDGGRSKFDVTGQKGDPKMIAVGKRALEAVGDSGFLIYLVSLGVDSVNITLFQDNDQFGAVATSPQKSAERARVIASGLNSYVLVGRTVLTVSSDERTLLEGTSVTAEGTSFVLKLLLPKATAQEMFTRRLKEALGKKAKVP